MKKIFIFLCFILFSSLYALDIFEEFRKNLKQEYLATFSEDILGVINASLLNDAESLRFFTPFPFSIGLNIRLYSAFRQINSNNFILKEAFKDLDFKCISLPILQIEKGLPYNIDFIGRFSSFYYKDFMFYGAGLRYKVFCLPFVLPELNFGVAYIYNFLEVKKTLKVNSTSFNLITSLNKLPVVSFYFIFGLDNGELYVDESLGVGNLKSSLSNKDRYEIGLNFSFIPFIYLNLAYGKVYNLESYCLGLGMKF